MSKCGLSTYIDDDFAFVTVDEKELESSTYYLAAWIG